MKQTIIQITHLGAACDQAAIEGAFNWITQQMTAADLADCQHVDVRTKLGETAISFSLMEVQEQAETGSDGDS